MKVPLLAICFTVASAAGLRPLHVSPGVEGVWRLVDLQSSDGATIAHDVPGLIVFTKTHYSITRATSSASRGRLDRAGFSTASIEQLRSVLEFVGEAGTYAVSGHSIVLTRIAALVPANIPGTSVTYAVIVTDGEMRLTQQSLATGATVSSKVTLRLTKAE